MTTLTMLMTPAFKLQYYLALANSSMMAVVVVMSPSGHGQLMVNAWRGSGGVNIITDNANDVRVEHSIFSGPI